MVDWDSEIEALVRDRLSARRTQPPAAIVPSKQPSTPSGSLRDEIRWQVRKEIRDRVEVFRLQQQRFARERRDFADSVLKSISGWPIANS
jgi:hypothetical protein